MAKTEISSAREKSWHGKPLRRIAGGLARPFDPAEELRDPKFIQTALLEALQAGDFEAVIQIYRAHLRVLNRTRTAKAMGVSRQYLHKMLKSSNTPSLRTFANFMRVLGKEAGAKR